MIKGYIFDYGGTLDTQGNHWGKVIWHAYERQTVPVTEEQFRDAYVHAERTLGKNRIIMPDFTFYRTLDTKLDIEMRYLIDNNIWNASETELKEKHDAVLEDLYKGVCDTVAYSKKILTKIADKGIPMVLVSNFYGNVNTVLSEFGLNELFPTVIESAVVGIRKPDPRIFGLGVEALGLPAEEIMVVGDTMDKDIKPAKSLGCKTAWYKGEPWKDNEEIDESQADIIINDLADLLNQKL